MIKETKGVIVGSDRKLTFGTIPLRAMGKNDVLIKVHSAPIDPSDLEFFKNLYQPGKHLPSVAGFEGSGLVMDAGENQECQELKGKRVAFFSTGNNELGSWGEYTVINRNNVFPLPHGVPLEIGACALLNPLTVMGIIETCIEKGHECIVHTAACSTLGRMLVKACKKQGITMINICRRAEQMNILQQLGAEHILNSSDDAFETDLAYRIAQFKPTAFFDAVGGKIGSMVFRHMPSGSTTYCYGMLADEHGYNISSADLMYKDKNLQGWWLSKELQDPERATNIVQASFEGLKSGDLKPVLLKAFPMEKFEEAIQFHEKHASEGKVTLFNPSFNI